MSAGNTYENFYLDAALGTGHTVNFPNTVYVALFTAAPNDAGGGTEVSGGAYARVAVTNNSTNFPNASGGSKSNGTVITFPTASGSWGTVTHFAIMDASSGGNIIHYGAVAVSKAIASGETAIFQATTLVITAD